MSPKNESMTVADLVQMLLECDQSATVGYMVVYTPDWSCGETHESEFMTLGTYNFLDLGNRVSIHEEDRRGD